MRGSSLSPEGRRHPIRSLRLAPHWSCAAFRTSLPFRYPVVKGFWTEFLASCPHPEHGQHGSAGERVSKAKQMCLLEAQGHDRVGADEGLEEPTCPNDNEGR